MPDAATTTAREAAAALEARLERLERLNRRLILAVGIVGGALVATLAGGVATQPRRDGPMEIASGTIMGLAIEDDVAYRIRANGGIEQIAIGERREALEQLQIADPRRRVPGLRWDPLFQP